MSDAASPYSALCGDDQAALSVLIEAFESQLDRQGSAALQGSIEFAPGRLRAALLTQALPLVVEQRRQRDGLTPTLHELRLAYPDLRSEIADVYQWLPPELRLPTEIGGYRVVAAIGEGAQAIVLKGQDDVHGAVAIKLSASARHNELLLRERETLAECKHRGVVSVTSSGLHHDRAYFVMPLLDGSTLADRYKSQRPSTREAVGVATQLAGAVAHLHKQGYLHRDLKPANVWIDHDEHVTLIDLGMAVRNYRFGEPVGEVAEFHGTPAYMAPEQAREDRKCDGRLADIFGVGGVLYWMLTGEAPFAADSGPAALERSAGGHLSREALGRLESHPEPVRRLCLEAIALDPSRRTPSAVRLSETLDAIHERLLRREIAAERPWYTSPLAALVAATLAVVGVGYAMQSQPLANTVYRPVISDTPPPEAWLPQVAERQGIDFASISADEFRVKVGSADRLAELGYTGDDARLAEGVLLVSSTPRLADLSESLAYRCGARRWRPLAHVVRPGVRYALLDARDLEFDAPIELRLGGIDEASSYAGPFQYEVRPREAIRADVQQLQEKRIADAVAADWLRADSPRWELSPAFVQAHGPDVRGLRFGATADRLDRLVSFAKPAAFTPDEAFGRASRGLQPAATLWAQLEFHDGRLTKPRPHYRRNRFGHDGSTRSALDVLASIPEGTPMGRMRESRFVPMGLARVDLALQAIEFGEAPDDFSIRMPVRAERRNGFLTPRDKQEADSHYVRLLNPPNQQRLKQENPEVVIDNGWPVTAVSLPPLWKKVCFRGRLHDGTTTAVYEVENELSRLGFTVEPAD
ncbi:MAG: serine/threonine-protein kinase, partial [Planctomycetota bacterium]